MSSTKILPPKTGTSPENPERCDIFSSGGETYRKLNDCKSASSTSSTTKVYLRLKPEPIALGSNEEESTYTVLNQTTLLSKCPSFDYKKRSSKFPKSSEEVIKRYSFARIFDQQTSQADFFDCCMKQHLLDFVSGKSSTVMTYGISNSGKTYTLYGTSESPGIIPRSLKFIFSEINCTLVPWYKFTQDNSIMSLDDEKRVREIKNKMRLLNSVLIDKECRAETRRFLDNSNLPAAESEEGENYSGGAVFSAWLSFAEIYNENIYDLLSVDDQERYRPLKLVTDKDGRTYVKNLSAVHVMTALEACQVMTLGQLRTTVVPTVLNSKSSRSHTIFLVKLLKYRRQDAVDEVQASTLSFYDLAGPGGSKLSEHVLARSVETRSINNSLLVLGRCLKAVCDSRLIKQGADDVAGPFRESKLTRMFQNALSGREHVSFIVNINLSTDQLMETQNTLHFSVVARKMMTDQSKELKRNASEAVLQNQNLVTNCDIVNLPLLPHSLDKSTECFIDSEEHAELKMQNENLALELKALKEEMSKRENACFPGNSLLKLDILIIDNENYEIVKAEKEDLKNKLESLKTEWLNREFEIRQELMNLYSNVIQNLEISWKKRTQQLEEEGQDLLKWSVNQVESFYKERIDSIIQSKKRKREDNDSIDENRLAYEALQVENAQITSKVLVLRETVEKLKQENEEILTEKNKSNFELALVKNELKEFQELAQHCLWETVDETDESCAVVVPLVDRLKSSIDEKIKNIEVLKKDLNDARNEYVRVSINAVKIEKELSESKKTIEKNAIKINELTAELFDKTNCIKMIGVRLHRRKKDLTRIREKQSEILDESIFEIDSEFKPKVSSSFSSPYYRRNSTNDYESNTYLNKSIQAPIQNYFLNDDLFDDNKLTESALISQGCVDFNIKCNYNFSQNDSLKKSSLNASDIKQKSYFRSVGSVENSTFRSSDGSLKEDSGIGMDSSNGSQRSTSLGNNIKIHETKDIFDDTNLESEDYKKVLRIVELANDSQNYYEIVGELREVVETSEYKALEYKETLQVLKSELEQLKKENRETTMKYHETLRMLETKAQEYETNLNELNSKLMTQEKNENCISKYVDNSFEKYAYLENQLSILHAQMEQSSIKCSSEHVPKIEQLEKELRTKNLQLSELDVKLIEARNDLLQLHKLFEKLNKFERILEKSEKEKNLVHVQLRERIEAQSIVEFQLKSLNDKIQEKEKEVIILKTEIENIMYMNAINSEQAKNLSKQVVESNKTVSTLKEELIRSKKLRKSIEKTLNQEIWNLKSRLLTFEKNYSFFLNSINESDGNRQEEVDRLKLQLLEKEWEMSLFKKNRDTTIRRYECLVGQLQTDLKKRKQYIAKLKKILSTCSKKCLKFRTIERGKFKVPVTLNKFSQVQELVKRKAYAWKASKLSKEVNEESASLIPTSSVSMQFNSQTVDISSSTVDDCSSTSKESILQLSKSDCQTRSDTSNNSETYCTCGDGFPNIEGSDRIADWMKVRRIGAKTELLLRSSRSSILSRSEFETEYSNCSNLIEF